MAEEMTPPPAEPDSTEGAGHIVPDSATGAEMDAATLREEWLRANRERILSDDRYFLYRLPLTTEQLDWLHASTMLRHTAAAAAGQSLLAPVGPDLRSLFAPRESIAADV